MNNTDPPYSQCFLQRRYKGAIPPPPPHLAGATLLVKAESASVGLVRTRSEYVGAKNRRSYTSVLARATCIKQ